MQDIALYRNGGMDEFGEWVTSNSWSGGCRLTESEDPHLRVNLMIRVYGRRWQGRSYPCSWVALLEVDGLEEKVAEGLCKSLRGVQKALATLDPQEGMQRLLKRLYAPARGYLVYDRMARPSVWGIVSDRGAWEPWCVSFGYLTQAAWNWPSGSYLAVRDGERKMVHRTSCCVSTNSLRPDDGDFGWLPQEKVA